MNKEEAEQKNIIIYWWNMGKKTLDFKGMAKDFMKEKGIKVSRFTKKGMNCYKIEVSTCSTTTIIKSFDTDYIQVINKGIMQYLQQLGDKTLYYDGYGREFKINWR